MKVSERLELMLKEIESEAFLFAENGEENVPLPDIQRIFNYELQLVKEEEARQLAG